MSYTEWVRKEKASQRKSGDAIASPVATESPIKNIAAGEAVSKTPYVDFVRQKKAQQQNSGSTAIAPAAKLPYDASEYSEKSPFSTAYTDFVRRKQEEEQNRTAAVTGIANSGYCTNIPSDTKASDLAYTDFVRKKKAGSSVYGWAKAAASLLDEMQTQIQGWSYKNIHADYSDKISSLLSQADTWRRQYAGNENAVAYIDSVASALSDLEKAASSATTYYAQWDSEDAYNQALAAYNLAQEQLTYDTVAGQKELDDLQELLNQADQITTWYSMYDMNPGAWDGETISKNMAIYDQLMAYGGKEALDQAIKDKRSYLDEAKALQKQTQQAMEAQEKEQEMLRFDTIAGQKEIDELTVFLAEINATKWTIDHKISPYDLGGKKGKLVNRLIQEFGTVTALEEAIAEKQTYLEKAKALQEWKKQSDYYDTLQHAPDFAEKSQYKTTYRGGEIFNAWTGTYTDTGYDDIQYDYINKDKRAEERQYLDDLFTNQAFYGLDKSYLKEMTEDEVLRYNYLYDPNDKTASDTYLAFLLSELNYRQRKRREQENAIYAQEKPFEASVSTIIKAPLKIFTAMGQYADYVEDGKIDQNAGYNKFSYESTAIRNQVASDIAKNSEVGSWLYQLGMSGGDFLMNTAISGGNSLISLALVGSSTMADTIISAKDRGLSDDQAFTLGIVAAGAEIITEKLSLDALFKGGIDKGVIKYILTNAFTEGTEEVGSSLINLFADILVSKDKSEWNMAIEAYMADNPDVSKRTAFWKVLYGEATSLGLDFLGGTLMGGTMGSAGAGIKSAGNAMYAKSAYGDSASELVSEALEIDPDNAFARKMQEKLDGGKQLSGRQLHRLVQQNEAALAAQDVSNIQSAAENRLNQLGETGDVPSIAGVLVKRATGEKLNGKDWKILAGSKYGIRVANELNPANIRSGQYSSTWAEGIGTERINAEAYNRSVNSGQHISQPVSTNMPNTNAAFSTDQDMLQRAEEVLGELSQQERSTLSAYQNQRAHLQSLEQKRQALLQQKEVLNAALVQGLVDRNALSQNAAQLSAIEAQISRAEGNLRQAMGTKTLSNLMQKLQSADIVTNIENNSQYQTNVLEKSSEHGIMNTEREKILQLGAKQKDLVEGKEVYWDNKTFDPYRKDWLGRTNIQRMQKGLAPIGHDGKSVNIHHIDQTDDGPVVEISTTEHSKYTKILHDNTGQKPSQINRREFNKWRYRYWKWRSQYWETGG